MENKDVISSREMNRLDANTESLGIPTYLLMELAGARTAEFAYQYYKLCEGKPISIMCGTGNNGGDGLVAARHLASKGCLIDVWLISEALATDISQKNLKSLKYLTDSIRIRNISLFQIDQMRKLISKSSLIIDALLGTGASGTIREPIRSVIALVNEISHHSNIPILAIDIPSGMNPDNGKVEDIAIDADSIITFHKKKPALTAFPSISSLLDLFTIKERTKCLTYVADIGIPPEADRYCGMGDLKICLKKRKKDAAKGQYGKVLIIGGSKDYSGAPALAAMAALQIGVDLVMVLTVSKIASVIRSYSPNLIVREVEGDYFSTSHIDSALEAIAWSDSVLIGPGIARTQEVRYFIKYLISHSEIFEKKVVFDADALSIIAEESLIANLKPCLLTPHRGELAKLLNGKATTEEKIIEFARTFNGTILAKGPVDLIVTAEKVIKNTTGCPEMSVGGTGDILAGLCVAFLSLQNSYMESACAAAYMNGKLGERYTSEISPGLISSKLLEEIPKFLRDHQKPNL